MISLLIKLVMFQRFSDAVSLHLKSFKNLFIMSSAWKYQKLRLNWHKSLEGTIGLRWIKRNLIKSSLRLLSELEESTIRKTCKKNVWNFKIRSLTFIQTFLIDGMYLKIIQKLNPNLFWFLTILFVMDSLSWEFLHAWIQLKILISSLLSKVWLFRIKS